MFKVIGSDGSEYGPVSAAELRQWLAQGLVTHGTLTQRQGDGSKWVPLEQFSEFAVAGTSVPPVIESGAPQATSQKRLGISMGAVALIAEIFGWLLWGGYVAQVRGDINIILWALAGMSLLGGGVLGLVAAIKKDGRVPGIIACVLVVLAFVVFG